MVALNWIGNVFYVPVRLKIGPFAQPDFVQEAPGLPKTRSGKIMRRILRLIAVGNRDIGDTTTLADESVVDLLFSLRPNQAWTRLSNTGQWITRVWKFQSSSKSKLDINVQISCDVSNFNSEFSYLVWVSLVDPVCVVLVFVNLFLTTTI